MTSSRLAHLVFSQGELICAVTRRLLLVIIANAECTFSTASETGEGGMTYNQLVLDLEESLPSGCIRCMLASGA